MVDVTTVFFAEQATCGGENIVIAQYVNWAKWDPAL